jgi:hypothetical protein
MALSRCSKIPRPLRTDKRISGIKENKLQSGFPECTNSLREAIERKVEFDNPLFGSEDLGSA